MNMKLQFDLTKWFLLITGHFMPIRVSKYSPSLEGHHWGLRRDSVILCQFLSDFHDFLHILSVEWS